MKYTITVTSEALGDIPAQEVFRQSVPELDLRAVINAVNPLPARKLRAKTEPAKK